MKNNVLDFIRSIDDLDNIIIKVTALGLSGENRPEYPGLAGLFDDLKLKSQLVRKNLAGLDARIERTMNEWESLKKNEIGLTILEKQIRQSLQQEQE
jgi:hypothetical protein